MTSHTHSRSADFYRKMKELSDGGGGSNPFKSAAVIKISAFLFVSLVFFYLGNHFSNGSSLQLTFFSSHQSPQSQSPPDSGVVGLSPNLNKSFDLSSLINGTASSPSDGNQQQLQTVAPPPPPPPLLLDRTGVVDENGKMTDDFEVGDYDPKVTEDLGSDNVSVGMANGGKGDDRVRVRIEKFEICPESMREYIPCLDNDEAIKKLNSTEKGEKFERHCPEKGKELNCLIPVPKGYRAPIPWPKSRDEVIFFRYSSHIISFSVFFLCLLTVCDHHDFDNVEVICFNYMNYLSISRGVVSFGVLISRSKLLCCRC